MQPQFPFLRISKPVLSTGTTDDFPSDWACTIVANFAILFSYFCLTVLFPTRYLCYFLFSSPERCTMVVTEWSRAAVITLYRQMLRKSHSLQLTDREFYLRRIQKEFHECKNIQDPQLKLRKLLVHHLHITVDSLVFVTEASLKHFAEVYFAPELGSNQNSWSLSLLRC
jgi:hypothetical protein